jgi:LDH2 family malate/lactate/ureidoglycolate dehydrogenase
MTAAVRIPAERLLGFARDVLLRAGAREDVARHVAESLVQTSVRGVDSHGIWLLPHYVAGVRGGRINPTPTYRFRRTAPAAGLLDADHTFGHAAGMEAARHAIELAKEAGVGFVAVYNSSHFGAAAPYALEIARHDMIGMSFTSTDALIKTYAGRRPFLGNNPLCITVPCDGEEPFCLDMATSAVTFNKIRQWQAQGLAAPPGVGADADGRETTDPQQVTSLMPIGGYKGYGLSMAIEILCSVLSGMPYGPHIPKMFEAPMSQKRLLGHCLLALRIDCFQEPVAFKKRLAMMLDELRREPRLEPDVPVQVPGDPEKRHARERTAEGVPLAAADVEALAKLGRDYDVPLAVEPVAAAGDSR